MPPPWEGIETRGRRGSQPHYGSVLTASSSATTEWTIRCGTGTYWAPYTGVTSHPPETDEDRHARIAGEAAAAQEAARADARAEELLRDFLSAEQTAHLTEKNQFDLTVASGRHYRVTRGRQGNIYLIENGRPRTKYCLHPSEFVPDADTMLAQKLLLEANEPEFLRVANATGL